jgi:hypothetical protein
MLPEGIRLWKTGSLEIVRLSRLGTTPEHIEIRQPKMGYLIYFPGKEVAALREVLRQIDEGEE